MSEIVLEPHSEVSGLIRTESIGDVTFELKGLVSLTSDKRIVVHNRSKVSSDKSGISCKFSNFSNQLVIIPKDTHVAWLKVENIAQTPQTNYVEENSVNG